jgi:DNA repair ATPase RecN
MNIRTPRPQNHSDILDSFGGSYLRAVHETFRLGADQTGIDHLKREKSREAERKELFSFEHREIEDAHLTGRREIEKKTILQNAEELMRTSRVYEIYGSDEVISHLNHKAGISEIAIIDPQLTLFRKPRIGDNSTRGHAVFLGITARKFTLIPRYLRR